MKKALLPLSLSILNLGFADGASNGYGSEEQKPDASAPLQNQMTNLPARPSVKTGYNFWLMGDVLYWQASEENLTYIISGTAASAVPQIQDLHTVDFDWDWGFRLGSGYNCVRDGWDVALYWTHIHSRANASKRAGSAANQQLTQVWTLANEVLTPPLSQAQAHWTAHLDQIDLQLGREAYAGKYLTLRPYIGMRTTWIHQDLDVSVVNTQSVSQHSDLKNHFWGYGFVAGMDTDWLFGRGFSLFANADYAILMGFFDVDETTTENRSLIWDISKSFRAGRSIFDLALGFKWSGLFCKERFGLTFKAGYEYHLYFDQNQLVASSVLQQGAAGSGGVERYSVVGGNLAYQGVLGSIQFDF